MEHEFKDCYAVLFFDLLKHYLKSMKVKKDSYDYCNQRALIAKVTGKKIQEAMKGSDESIELSEESDAEVDTEKQEGKAIQGLGSIKI